MVEILLVHLQCRVCCLVPGKAEVNVYRTCLRKKGQMLSSTKSTYTPPEGFLTTDPRFCVRFKHVINDGGVVQGSWWIRSWQQVAPGRQPSRLAALQAVPGPPAPRHPGPCRNLRTEGDAPRLWKTFLQWPPCRKLACFLSLVLLIFPPQ